MIVNRLICRLRSVQSQKMVIKIDLHITVRTLTPLIILIATLSLLFSFPHSLSADLSSDLEQVTGNRTKIVFARCVAGDGNSDLVTPDYSLGGFDSYRNEFFEVVSGPRYCANPIITPDGNAVLFSDLGKKRVNIVSWAGTDARMFVSGYALSVQRDTATKTDWVYVSDSAYGNSITRYNLTDTSQHETIWDKTRVSIRFTVSADGRFAGGEFPWPVAGEISIKDNEFKMFGSGCNTAIAPDNSYRLFHMEATHRSIWMYDSNAKVINQLLFDAVTGEGNSAWIPRWSNDVRFFTLTAPCQPYPKTHKDDIYFGCFSESCDSITQWIRITNTADTIENYAYAWIGKERYLKLDHYNISFIHSKTGISTENRTITVSSPGGSLQECAISVSENWISVKSYSQDGKIMLEHSIDTTLSMPPALHSALVTVTCNDFTPEIYCVNLKIENEAATPVSLKIAPNNQKIEQFDSLQFTAICFDQYKTTLNGSYGWSVSGGGTIRDSGLFVSNGDTGNFTVKTWLLSIPELIDSTIITVYENPQIVAPDINTTVCAEDSLYIKWRSNLPGFKDLLVYLSIDNGRTWKLLNTERAIYPHYDTTGNYAWAISRSLCDNVKDSKRLNKCKIKITDYNDNIRTISQEPFTINCSCSGNGTIPQKPLSFVPQKELTKTALFTLTGKLIYSVDQSTETPSLKSLPRGVYLLKITSSKKVLHKKLLNGK